ncbi:MULTISPECIES: hypothetical protein, partial [Enterobacterales]
VPAYGPQNDVTLKMPAFEWVHVQLHQQKGMISLSPPTICNSATENYLNCVNSESGRVRVEAKRASEEYGRVLRRYPLKPGETVERPQRGEVVSSSGVLPPLDPGEY